MTHIQELVSNLELVGRLIDAFTCQDLERKGGKEIFRILLVRKEKYERLIKAYEYEPRRKA